MQSKNAEKLGIKNFIHVNRNAKSSTIYNKSVNNRSVQCLESIKILHGYNNCVLSMFPGMGTVMEIKSG